MSPAKIWQLCPHDAAAIERLSTELRISPILAQLLLNRGLTHSEPARRFLTSPLSALHEPELLPGVPEAVDRLMDAINHKRRICIYGDYDVDGVTGTATLLTLLRMLGANVDFFVPNRLEDGYGLNCEALRKLAEKQTAVVVTVDCGITSVQEADEAQRIGIELIVTDHHEPKMELPRAALVHPRIGNGRSYPFGELSGAGVAFKLAWALCKRACGSDKVSPQYREFLLDSVVLAALGTIADVVPLRGENRIFARFGLNRLQKCPSVGLRSLLKAAGLAEKSELESMDIGFGLAPRLNAAGRLATARLAVELLTTQSLQRAEELASSLEDHNQRRQLMEQDILREAKEQAQEYSDLPALILSDPSWHPGLIGIVASRLVDLYSRPVVMIAQRDAEGPGTGSGRSIPGFKLHEALQACTTHLLGHGGHAAAAGFRIVPDEIDAFRQSFIEVARQHFGDSLPTLDLRIDAELPLSALTWKLIQSLSYLEPYGASNPRPVFLAGNLQVAGEPRLVGNGERHLSFQVRQEGKYLRAVGFGMADRLEELMSDSGRCSLAFTPRINEWQGMKRIELLAVDFQPGPEARLGRPAEDTQSIEV